MCKAPPRLALIALLGGFSSPMQAADIDAGEKVFKKCSACHQVGEGAENRTGPVLNGIVGRAVGLAPEFKYSDAMLDSGLTWDEATLTAYLSKPKDVVAGTRMAFAGLKKPDDIANVIAFLATYAADGARQ